MTVSSTDKTIAIIAANGFDENHMTEIQRTLTAAKLAYKVIAPEQGLVNGWQDNAWGHYFTVDIQIGAALGSDFDALVLVGGERATAKLQQNLHTRRIVNHFLEADKPVAAIGSGVSLLALSSKIANRTVAALPEMQESLKAAGVIIAPEAQEQDGHLLTATGSDRTAWANAALNMISTAQAEVEQQAA